MKKKNDRYLSMLHETMVLGIILFVLYLMERIMVGLYSDRHHLVEKDKLMTRERG